MYLNSSTIVLFFLNLHLSYSAPHSCYWMSNHRGNPNTYIGTLDKTSCAKYCLENDYVGASSDGNCYCHNWSSDTTFEWNGGYACQFRKYVFDRSTQPRRYFVSAHYVHNMKCISSNNEFCQVSKYISRSMRLCNIIDDLFPMQLIVILRKRFVILLPFHFVSVIYVDNIAIDELIFKNKSDQILLEIDTYTLALAQVAIT